jgi:hypothetical protein
MKQNGWINQPPNKPVKPVGPTTGAVNRLYRFTTTTADPDGDYIYYQWNWGDGNISEWIGPYKSNMKVLVSHSWTRGGTYQIKVKAKDIRGLESSWSDPLRIRIFGLGPSQSVEGIPIEQDQEIVIPPK